MSEQPESSRVLDASKLVERYHEGQEADLISDPGQTSHPPLSLSLLLSFPLSMSALLPPCLLSFSFLTPSSSAFLSVTLF